jgi:hypothetical protein
MGPILGGSNTRLVRKGPEPQRLVQRPTREKRGPFVRLFRPIALLADAPPAVLAVEQVPGMQTKPFRRTYAADRQEQKRRLKKPPLSPSPYSAAIGRDTSCRRRVLSWCRAGRQSRCASRSLVRGSRKPRKGHARTAHPGSKDHQSNSPPHHSKVRQRQRQPCRRRRHLRDQRRTQPAGFVAVQHPQRSRVSTGDRPVPGRSRLTVRRRLAQTKRRRTMPHTQRQKLQGQPFLYVSWTFSLVQRTPRCVPISPRPRSRQPEVSRRH